MLKRVDENADRMDTRLPKSLATILSFPGYKFSPCSSPRKYDDGTAQMRLPLHGTSMHNEENSESQSCISEENVQPHEMNVNCPLREDLECPAEAQSFAQCSTVSQAAEAEEMVESKSQQEETIFGISSKSCRTSLDEDFEKGGSRGVENEGRASEFLQQSSTCSKSDLCEEDEILSSSTVLSSHPPVSLEVKDPFHENGKEAEHPSPISILEPLFTDDDISPTCSTSRPVEKEILPRRINFEEQPGQEICMGISVEGVESEFEYVEAVLLGSGLNRDEFLMRWVSLDEILDSSLFHEVELFSRRPRHDQKLLFDCANESLKEVCNNYFGWLRFTGKSNIGAIPIPSGMDLIDEIWNGVEGRLCLYQPHSLEQLVRMDLEIVAKWMNLRSDTEVSGVDMEEAIFSELVDDLVTSFVNDIATEASSS